MAGDQFGLSTAELGEPSGQLPAVVAVDNPQELSLGVGSGARRANPLSRSSLLCKNDIS